ncbi:hypothetical protein F5Y15DRAFT_399204 [Xylariaceae sp. FL0016]|nr:hypothetical protein F5Y15DRAFT_399204 [Xylariaceae sp. FL0016]
MFLRALRGEEKALGPDHPNTLGVAYNLGLLYLSKRRFTAAEEMLLRALRGYDKTMGAEEISTYRPAINATLNMGILLWEQGKPLEALPYYQRAHCNLEGLLGSTHEDVQKLREEMAKLQEEMVELSKAERKKQ